MYCFFGLMKKVCFDLSSPCFIFFLANKMHWQICLFAYFCMRLFVYVFICVFVYLCGFVFVGAAMQSVFWVRLSGSTSWRHLPPKAPHPTTPKPFGRNDDAYDHMINMTNIMIMILIMVMVIMIRPKAQGSHPTTPLRSNDDHDQYDQLEV